MSKHYTLQEFYALLDKNRDFKSRFNSVWSVTKLAAYIGYLIAIKHESSFDPVQEAIDEVYVTK